MIRKKDIIKNLSKDFTMSMSLTSEIVNHILNQIKNELITWNDVVIREFFTLSVKDAIWRSTVSPWDWKSYPAKTYRKLRCTFSSSLKDLVKNYKK